MDGCAWEREGDGRRERERGRGRGRGSKMGGGEGRRGRQREGKGRGEEHLKKCMTSRLVTYDVFFPFISSTISRMVSQSGSDRSELVAFSVN